MDPLKTSSAIPPAPRPLQRKGKAWWLSWGVAAIVGVSGVGAVLLLAMRQRTPGADSDPGADTPCSGRYVVLQQPTSGDNDDGSGLVRDTRTGLTWMSKPYAGAFNQAQAASYCQSKGMRLPTKDEARGIAGENWETCAFPSHWWAWSSTSAGSGRAWVVSHYGNAIEPDVGYSIDSVLCVR